MIPEKPKVILLTDNNLDTVGGEQESTKIILEGLADRFDLTLFQPGAMSDSKKNKNVRYVGWSKKQRLKEVFLNPFLFLLYMVKVGRHLKAGNFSIVHTQAQASFFIVSILIRLKIVPKGFTFIHTERGFYKKYSAFVRRVFLFCMPQLDVMVFTTALNRDLWLKDALSVNGELKVSIIENTAGPLFEEPLKDSKGEGGNSFVIGFAGRYCDWKNWPLAVDIVSKIVERAVIDDFQVHVAVGCLDNKSLAQTKNMFAEFEELLGERFNGRVNISLADMERFYRGVNIFVLTSHPGTESFGRTVVEAMSKECVVLTTGGGGPEEVVGDAGVICVDSEEFAEKIESYYFNREKMRRKIDFNMGRVASLYSSGANIRKHLELYSSCVF